MVNLAVGTVSRQLFLKFLYCNFLGVRILEEKNMTRFLPNTNGCTSKFDVIKQLANYTEWLLCHDDWVHAFSSDCGECILVLLHSFMFLYPIQIITGYMIYAYLYVLLACFYFYEIYWKYYCLWLIYAIQVSWVLIHVM